MGKACVDVVTGPDGQLLSRHPTPGGVRYVVFAPNYILRYLGFSTGRIKVIQFEGPIPGASSFTRPAIARDAMVWGHETD